MIHIGYFMWQNTMNNTAALKLQALIKHLEGAYAPNTLRAYRADMQEFILFCENHGLPALPASSATVASFLMGTLTGPLM